MLERGHFQELHDLLEKINANPIKREKRQTFVFSATLTMVHDLPEYLEKKKRRYAKSRINKLTSDQKLEKIISLLKIKKPKIVDLTKESGTYVSLVIIDKYLFAVHYLIKILIYQGQPII